MSVFIFGNKNNEETSVQYSYQKISGGDALMGHTRSHSEHDG